MKIAIAVALGVLASPSLAQDTYIIVPPPRQHLNTESGLAGFFDKLGQRFEDRRARDDAERARRDERLRRDPFR